MPTRILNDVERARYQGLPDSIPPADLIAFFTLSASDLALVRRRTGDYNRLSVALDLCALRYVGFFPEDISAAPAAVVSFLTEQLGMSVDSPAPRGGRGHTRRDQFREVQGHLGFRRAKTGDLAALDGWLLERALEHDAPTLLFELACEKLHSDRIVRPRVVPLERMVARARQHAQRVTYESLGHLLTQERKGALDRILLCDPSTGRTPLAWLRQPAVTNSPRAILDALEKRAFLKDLDIHRWNLTASNPNRLKALAQVGRRSTSQMLERAPAPRRYPILVAFLRQSFEDVTDAAISMFDRCLADAYARSRHDLDDFRKATAKAANEKVRLFEEVGRIVLDPEVSDERLRAVIYERVSPERLRAAVDECADLVRPPDDEHFDLLATRYAYLRQFASIFLGAFDFKSDQARDPLLEAVAVLRRLNAEGLRKIPDGATLDHVSDRWRGYVVDASGHVDRRYYELCTLWELRGALRAGNIWLEGSRRYANPATYLIPKDRWETSRFDICRRIKAPEDGTVRFDQRRLELEDVLARLDASLAHNDTVRIEDGKLVITPLKAEDQPASVRVLQEQITARLPRVDLVDLFIEVDRWTRFSDHFEHAGGSEPRSKDLLIHVYATVLAHACNLGLSQMAAVADLTYRRLAWCNNWYVREETLRPAITAIVNFQHRHPLSRAWGGGTLSSSDGQRFPVSVKARNATALPRYFGFGRGLTHYSWTSDQFSQYGTKVIPSTLRDATYVLDGILGNETELPIIEHTTDTSGYTELVFALFDLLGMQFAPRIRDIGGQTLYRVGRAGMHSRIDPLVTGKIHSGRILSRWDDMLRVAGSLKTGWVTASLLIGKLQAYPQKNALTLAIQEYGRLVKTLFIGRYLESHEYRRRIHKQLNKGEALHSLRRFLFFANEGSVRKHDEESQSHQAMCLTLMTNAVITWNTVYIAAALEDLKSDGVSVADADVEHLSPCRYEHVNPYGKYQFRIDEGLGRKELRPLRQP